MFILHLMYRFMGEIDKNKKKKRIRKKKDCLNYSPGVQNGPNPGVTCFSYRENVSNGFSSETTRPIKAKCYMEPQLVEGTKVCSLHLGLDQDGHHAHLW